MAEERMLPYIRQVEHEHRELESLLRRLDDALLQGASEGWNLRATERALELLIALQDHLKYHFAQEEAGGYLEEALSVAPRFSHQADQLLRQHPMLAAMIADAIDEARRHLDDPPHWLMIEAAITEMLKKLKAHEAGENRILEEAFNTDLGLAD